MAVTQEDIRNGRSPNGEFEEVGTPGIESTLGLIQKAYTRELDWPNVEPLYSRIWRSDPETTIVRNMFSALSSTVRLRWELPEHVGTRALEAPTDDDFRALDFAMSLDEDIDGGLLSWIISCMERVSFYGWGWWETPLGIRNPSWRAPNADPWESRYDDNLVGLRRIAFRDYSSLYDWGLNDTNGRLYGMRQYDYPNDPVLIPLDRSLHITYGDSDNPEGLATLEAIYRLERYKYALELVQGIGFEHSAGHVKFMVKDHLGATEKTLVNKAARALLTAQEGNYITEVEDKFSADIMDVPFQAASDILAAIRYYGILKLSLYGMQFATMSSISGVGSYSALTDSSSMAMLIFNSMKNGFVRQFNRQVSSRIFSHPTNASAFSNMTRVPQLVASDVSKSIELAELAAFTQAISMVLPLSNEDVISIRRASGILTESLPEDDETAVSPEDMQEDEDDESGSQDENEDAPVDDDEDEEDEDQDDADFSFYGGETAVLKIGDIDADIDADIVTRWKMDIVDGEVVPVGYFVKRPFTIPDDELPTSTLEEEIITDADIDRAMRKYEKWAKENDPDMSRLLFAQEEDEDDESQ